MLVCSVCAKPFTRSDNLRRHQRVACVGNFNPSIAKKPRLEDGTQQAAISANVQTCTVRNKTIPTDKMGAHERTLEHRTNACVNYRDGVYVIENAFKCRIVSYRLECRTDVLDYNTFFNENKATIISSLDNMISIHHSIKVNMEVFGRYILQSQDLHDIKSFMTPNHIMDSSLDLEAVVDTFKDILLNQTTEFEERDSGELV